MWKRDQRRIRIRKKQHKQIPTIATHAEVEALPNQTYTHTHATHKHHIQPFFFLFFRFEFLIAFDAVVVVVFSALSRASNFFNIVQFNRASV